MRSSIRQALRARCTVRSWLALGPLAVLVVALAGPGLPSPASATVSEPAIVRGSDAPAPLPVLAPVTNCEQLAHADVSQAVGAGTWIASTTMATAPQGYPYCDIKGFIAPQIQFELQLPTRTYQQRYLQNGCGGLCGAVSITESADSGCAPVNDGAFAMAADDMGHADAGTKGIFGADPQLRVDFAYSADHLLTLTAKALIATFYGHAPRYSYFDGCSTGGLEALAEAQRYPHDFAGIIAGAPASITTYLATFYQTWIGTVDFDSGGKPILPASKLPFLHSAVMANCDGKDGLVDGEIEDPRACTFDPATLACPQNTDAPTCLTSAQIAVVRKIYSGPVDARGRHLYPGGEPMGSELAWSSWFLPADASATRDSTVAWTFGNSWAKYLAFTHNPPLSFTAADVHFDESTFREVSRLAGLYDATDPDLTAFRNAGGKLIIWQGWADQGVSPYGTVAYYQAIQDHMGGLQATQQFARLFMFPGIYHCAAAFAPSDAPDTFDLLTPLLNWTETGTAPAKVVASKSEDGAVVRTRPVFPYPEVAHYTGTGSINDAANFVGAPPVHHFDDHFNWLGSFSAHDELWGRSTDNGVIFSRRPPSGQR
jgi:feruloyl esterase